VGRYVDGADHIGCQHTIQCIGQGDGFHLGDRTQRLQQGLQLLQYLVSGQRLGAGGSGRLKSRSHNSKKIENLMTGCGHGLRGTLRFWLVVPVTQYWRSGAICSRSSNWASVLALLKACSSPGRSNTAWAL